MVKHVLEKSYLFSPPYFSLKTHGHLPLIALYGLLKCKHKLLEKDNTKLGDE